jgi:hypothetical protein
MKTDRYTKVILTVIAVCMVVNIIEKFDFTSKAYANESESKITATALPDPQKYGLVPMNPDGSISVTMKTIAPMDVNIVGIKTSDDLDVNVNLEKIGGYSTYGEIPVKVKQ